MDLVCSFNSSKRNGQHEEKTPLIKKHGSMVMAMMQATPQTR